MKAFIITGTDTNIGKTIVTAGLANYFSIKKKKFSVQKWISTGDKHGISDDLLFIYNSLNLKNNDNLFTPIHKNIIKQINDIKMHNPYSFKFPASPHLSAQLEKQKIDIQKIKYSINYFKNKTDYLLIEGIGGLLVPLTQQTLLIDLIKQLHIPVLLVSANNLGTINKTLSAIKILQSFKVKILGIIYNNFIKEDPIIREDNKKIIYKYSKVKILGEINVIEKKKFFIKDFKKIGDILFRIL